MADNINTSSSGLQTVDVVTTSDYLRDLAQAKVEKQFGKRYTGENTKNQKKMAAAIEEEVKHLKEAIEAQIKYNKYLNASLSTKRDIKQQDEKILEQEIEIAKIAIEQAENDEQKEQHEKNLEIMLRKQTELRQQIANMNNELLRAENTTVSLKEKQAVLEEKSKKAKEIYLKYQQDINKAEKEGNTEEVKKLKAERDKELKDSGLDKYNKRGFQNIFSAFGQDTKNNLNKEGLSGAFSEGLDKLVSGGKSGEAVSSFAGSLLPSFSAALGPVVAVLSSIANIAGKINQTLDKGVKEAAEMQNTYLGSINARLQGGTDSYQDYMKFMRENLSLDGGGRNIGSAFVSQKTLLENINKLVQEGVGFNVEERAMLMTLSDKMVTTFEVLNPTLKRLARIQQADVTSSQLGYEALLTRFLNSYFQDTSYLSDVYDSVAGTLLDASSQLTAQASTEFNYAVQKWLASLYSVGMSESGVSKIAQGISYLATGNIEALNSDDALRTLFASAAGGSYSSILTGGLNAATVNDLLNNIVKYLQSIAGDTNQVTKRAMAGVFGGFDLSDIRAITNLDASMINTINNSMPTYNDSLKEVVNQLDAVTRYQGGGNKSDIRASLPALYDTIFDNLIFSYGADLVSDEGKNGSYSRYATWKIEDIASKQGGIVGMIGEVSKTVSSLWHSIFGDESETSAYDVFKGMWDAVVSAGDKTAWINQFQDSTFYQNIKSAGLLTRGVASDYQSLLKEGTATGISAMSRYGISQAGMADLSTTSSATASRATTIGTQQTKDITALYAELFERQTTAMKVSLSNIDVNAASTLSNIILNNAPQSMKISGVNDSVLDALSATMHIDTIDDINNKLSDTLEVSISDNFLNEINSGLNYARGI